MINYYKLKVSYYRIDTDSKSFTQVNDAPDASSIGVCTNEKIFEGLSGLISDEWLVISEEQFIFAKEEILNKLK